MSAESFIRQTDAGINENRLLFVLHTAFLKRFLDGRRNIQETGSECDRLTFAFLSLKTCLS